MYKLVHLCAFFVIIILHLVFQSVQSFTIDEDPYVTSFISSELSSEKKRECYPLPRTPNIRFKLWMTSLMFPTEDAPLQAIFYTKTAATMLEAKIEQFSTLYDSFVMENVPSQILKQVEKDLPRTPISGKNGMIFFGLSKKSNPEASLKKLMLSTFLLDKEVGYVQGMNYVLAFLLGLFGERQAFFIFAQIIRNRRYRELYADLSKAISAVNLLSLMIRKLVPSLEEVFLETSPELCLSLFIPCLMQIYAGILPFTTTAIIWETMILTGPAAIYAVFLHFVLENKSLITNGPGAFLPIMEKMKAFNEHHNDALLTSILSLLNEVNSILANQEPFKKFTSTVARKSRSISPKLRFWKKT